MPEPRRILIVAKQREFDEEQWKQLLMAMAYYLHEQSQVQAVEQTTTKGDAPTKT